MNEKYIELRTRSTFGDIINTYFLFLKYNFKTYTNLYLRYNAISIILTLICSYLLVTGFMGLVSRDFRFGMSNNVSTDSYLIAGSIILLLIAFLTFSINYSFSSAYIADYANNEGKVESKRIWKSIISNIGTIIIFILIGGLLYIVYLVAAGILSLIPFLGFLIQYGLNFTMSAIFGLTFMSIFSTKKGFGEAISEGFDFTFSNFWRLILFGFVVGILSFVFMLTLFQIPSYLMGIYVYFSVESGVDITTSTLATLFFTLWFAIIIISTIYIQALSQVAYGILYYNLFEGKYNEFLQKKIDQIGVNE
ncbi:hypothetical protein [uncultured Winogradskyella sp.]|uniref:hypothetical protein n=1 Tax=uncultured Winogradskyella sp. TaxID=395353 RepID=UPI002602CBF8|nr:hypothetical protein [uncultured Winogradskyella sp.]